VVMMVLETLAARSRATSSSLDLQQQTRWRVCLAVWKSPDRLCGIWAMVHAGVDVQAVKLGSVVEGLGSCARGHARQCHRCDVDACGLPCILWSAPEARWVDCCCWCYCCCRLQFFCRCRRCPRWGSRSPTSGRCADTTHMLASQQGGTAS
jgi:hypothetical protein